MFTRPHHTSAVKAGDLTQEGVDCAEYASSVRFISDIGAHRLKPLFVVGGIITSVTYIGTIFAANYARRHAYGLQTGRYQRACARVALVGGVCAGLGCILLTGFDTYRWHSLHQPLLLAMFLGIGISAICTAVVYADITFLGSEHAVLRKRCVGESSSNLLQKQTNGLN